MIERLCRLQIERIWRSDCHGPDTQRPAAEFRLHSRYARVLQWLPRWIDNSGITRKSAVATSMLSDIEWSKVTCLPNRTRLGSNASREPPRSSELERRVRVEKLRA